MAFPTSAWSFWATRWSAWWWRSGRTGSYQSTSEGGLTSLRAALVQDETLARVARSLGLGRFMLMGRGEDAGGGRERTSNLAALFEALAGAVYLDQGFEAARGFVTRTLEAEMAAVDPAPPRNAKSLLQEALQGQGLEPPTYRIVGIEGADHARTYTAEVEVAGEALARGRGPRKAAAERAAAERALEGMEGAPPSPHQVRGRL